MKAMMAGMLVVLGMAAQGCDMSALGCEAAPGIDSTMTVKMDNPSQSASLVKAGCGTSVDTYQLTVSDSEGTKLDISFTGTPRINEASGLALAKDASLVERGTAANGVSFSMARAAQGFETGDVNSGAITVTSLPRASGDRMDVRVQLYFLNGRIMDQTFGATVVSTPCVAQ